VRYGALTRMQGVLVSLYVAAARALVRAALRRTTT
jgi:hypothetical protein